VSRPPYGHLNLGDHVGDDPEAVAENRSRLATRVDVPHDQLVFMHQVHGAEVVVAEPTVGPVDADALVTTRPGLPLVVLVADCVPVVFRSSDPPVVAVAHAGRRGLVARVVPATVEVMRKLGANPANMKVFIGPSICGFCYEVPEALRAEVIAVVPAAQATTRAGTSAVDVSRGVRAQLHDAGISTIKVDRRCTNEFPELYSHRRDGRTGRFAAVTWLQP